MVGSGLAGVVVVGGCVVEVCCTETIGKFLCCNRNNLFK